MTPSFTVSLIIFLAMLYVLYQKQIGKMRFTFRGSLYVWIAFFGSIFMLIDSLSK